MEILRKNKGLNLFYELYTEKAGFAEEMLQNNHFQYLPHVRLQWTDMRCSLLYKADGMQSFASRFAREEVDWLRIRELLRDLAGCIEEVQEYLLAPEGIVLSTAYILYDEGKKNYRFLYLPEPEMSFAEGMKQLLEEIMPRFAHGKREEVVRFYELYSKFLDDRFTPAMLIRMVEQWDVLGAAQGRYGGFPAPEGEGRNVFDPKSSSVGEMSHSVGVWSRPVGVGSCSNGVGSRSDGVGSRSGKAGSRSVGAGSYSAGPAAPAAREMKTSGRPWGIYALIAGAVLAAALLYLWKGGESLKFSALLGVAVAIVIYIGSSGRRKKEGEARDNRDPGTLSGNAGSGEIRGKYGSYPPVSGGGGERREIYGKYPPMSGGGGESREIYGKYPPMSGSGGENRDTYGKYPPMNGEAGYEGEKDGYSSPVTGDISEPQKTKIDPSSAAGFGYPKVNRVTRLVPSVGSGQPPIVVAEGVLRIGRSEVSNEYCISAPGISRNHARLECSGGVVNLADLHSTNGTFVNQERIGEEQTRELHYGDVVSFAGEEYYCV